AICPRSEFGQGDAVEGVFAQPAAVTRTAARMMNAIIVAFMLVMGLAVGSFLNVCIYRLPIRKSVMFPASHCPICNRSLAWFENIPVVSWLVLGGRCRTCRTPIPVQYPLVEAITCAAFVSGYFIYGWTPL